MDKKFFTSESVSEGHPDKIADQISDAVLDAILAQDSDARVACETYVKSGTVIIGGEISTTAKVDFEQIVRKTIYEIGYAEKSFKSFNANSCDIFNMMGLQSNDIIQSILPKAINKKQNAGDQGIVFGYATNETDSFMPAPILYAHALMGKQAEVRKNGQAKGLKPDAKVQITFGYEKQRISHVDNVIFSTQHYEYITKKKLEEIVMELIIKPVLPAKWLSRHTKFFINPSGRFVCGGPMADCGLTGRKIIVDTYGGIIPHGGGGFSGKDPSKIDRSAAYAARYIAKNLVAAKIVEKCIIQICYAIGCVKPVAVDLETFGTEKINKNHIFHLINNFFDLTPEGVIRMLNLRQPIYQSTASYGHFGRKRFPWEKIFLSHALHKVMK